MPLQQPKLIGGDSDESLVLIAQQGMSFSRTAFVRRVFYLVFAAW